MTDRAPHEVRDELIADYSRTAERGGLTSSSTDIERIVMADLATYEAVTREARRVAPIPCAPDPRQNEAIRIAKAKGQEFYRRPVPDKEKKQGLLETNPMQIGEKFASMMGRIRRILQPRGNVRQASIEDAAREMEVPALAREFVELWLNYNMQRREFRGLSRRDRARLFIRKTEDICDRSTGVLGFWWVK